MDDKEARVWWSKCFSQNNTLRTDVPFETFLMHLSNHLRVASNLKIFQGLRSMLGEIILYAYHIIYIIQIDYIIISVRICMCFLMMIQ